jgi:hypothetical protein
MMTMPFDPETAENNPDIEKQWAVKALDHAEVYMRLLQSMDSTHLKLTRCVGRSDLKSFHCYFFPF